MLQKCLLYRHIQSEIGEEDFCSFGCNLSLQKATKKAFYHPPILVNYVYEALPLLCVWFHDKMKKSWVPNLSWLNLIIFSVSYFPRRHTPWGSGCSSTGRMFLEYRMPWIWSPAPHNEQSKCGGVYLSSTIQEVESRWDVQGLPQLSSKSEAIL